MPLPMPRLDNRTFDQLVAEGQVLLPRYAPHWTDHNVHDPGITLIELFAWLVEMDFYRLDRTTDASYRTFLRLVGVEPRPAQVAETVVVLAQKQPGSPIHLPAGFQIGNADGSIVFQTTDALHVSAGRLLAVLTGPADALMERSNENQSPGERYPAFGAQPQPGHALYLGFDRPLADQPVEMSMYLWAGPAEADRETRERLKAEWEAARKEATADCPQNIEPDLPAWRQHYSARTVWQYHAESNRWAPLAAVTDETRGLSLSGRVRFTTPNQNQHAPGGVSGGQHAGHYFIRCCRLASGGYECPPQVEMIALNAVPVRHAEDVKPEEVLRTSDGRTGSDGRAGQVFQLRHSPVVPGSTRLRVGGDRQDEVISSSTGRPWQVLYLRYPPVMPATQVITVGGIRWQEVSELKAAGSDDLVYKFDCQRGAIHFGDAIHGRIPEAGALIRATYEPGWQEVLFWDRVGPHERAYVLSPETGEIAFGNGRIGRVPLPGAEIGATYQVGSGPSGNVAAGALTRLLGNDPSEVSVVQPFAAIGGAAAESLSDAIGRAVAHLAYPQRAVTLEDFEKLALATPGVPIARAHALADYDPRMPCLPAQGSVTIVVVPRCPEARPEPGSEMLREVARYLERRRTLTTELHVIGPDYTTVSARARLHTGPDTDMGKLIKDARAKLDRFFRPLHGGPDGGGWPIGRDVYRAEVMALLNALPNVTHVDEVSLYAEKSQESEEAHSESHVERSEASYTSGEKPGATFGATSSKTGAAGSCCSSRDSEKPPDAGARCGNLSICPHDLVASGQHHITVARGVETGPAVARMPLSTQMRPGRGGSDYE